MCVFGGKVLAVCISDGLHFSTTSISIYHKHLSDIRVKSYGPSLPCYILSVSIGFRPYAEIQRKGYGRSNLRWASFFQHRASQYIININQTSKSKVMAVRICMGIPFQLSSTMIYYGAQLDIRVKTFARQNLPESSLFKS